MLQPAELRRARRMELHEGVWSTTTLVWEMLTAAEAGDLARVRALGEESPQLHSCQYDYTTALHLAVRTGHLDVVRHLVEHGALDPTYSVHPFRDPLALFAVEREELEIADFLRRSMNERKVTRSLPDVGAIDRGMDEGQRLFERAVSDGKHGAVAAMLADRPALALDEESFWGEGVLSVPANRDDRRMVELLMAAGARVPAVSKWGARYYFKHEGMAAFLLEHGMRADHMSWRRFTLLHDMGFTGEMRKATLLLDHGADLEAVDDEYSSTPLGYAVHWGKPEMVALLLERGADPDGAGAAWATPMAWARRQRNEAIVRMLRTAGARAE